MSHGAVWEILLVVFVIVQSLYLLSFAVDAYFYSRPVDWISTEEDGAVPTDPPPVLLLYPVLHEAEETMRTTMLSIAAARDSFPDCHVRVVAIPNSDDVVTISALERVSRDFEFLDILEVPPTSDPSWGKVWSDWDLNPKAYWWHTGKRAGEWQLPPKKTRQLIYAMYTFDPAGREGWLLSYLDADSAVPRDYFKVAAIGSRSFDVVQLTNVAGNLSSSWASALHGTDHMAWDGAMYPHMTAHGRHPFYVLGKGLFYRLSDLVELGGFNPWLTIEDPEVGMRLWTNGRRLGVSDSPLIEEVPSGFHEGLTQRKRWVAGFFQSLQAPLTLMGMTGGQRMRARLNLVPVLSLAVNAVGVPISIWALVETVEGTRPLDVAISILAAVDLAAAIAVLARIYWAAWSRSKLVLDTRRARAVYLLRINPLVLIGYWLWWCVPLAVGFTMFVRDRGLTWQRTEKVDANHVLVRHELGDLDGSQIVDLEAQPREVERTRVR